MSFDKEASKAIQIKRETDSKLVEVMKAVEKAEQIKLGSRDKTIDMLATRYLNTVETV